MHSFFVFEGIYAQRQIADAEKAQLRGDECWLHFHHEDEECNDKCLHYPESSKIAQE